MGVGGSNPSGGANKELIMKQITFENIFNHERFKCNDVRDVQIIDGVEYLKVNRLGNDRILLMRKDSLKKVVEPKKLR